MARNSKKDWNSPRSGNPLEDGYTREAGAPRPSGKGLLDINRSDSFDERRDFMVAVGGFSSARSRVRSMIEDDDFFHPW
jgi:hypothetical protein